MSAAEDISQPTAIPGEGPVTLPSSVQFDLVSTLNGRAYRIFVFAPMTPPPPAGYPLIVASDGNMTFPIAATLNGTLALGGGQCAVVVGVGYPTDHPMELVFRRLRDLTPATPLAGIPAMPGWPEPKIEDFGGADEFFRFITEELRPLIASRWPIDPAEQTLFGHSLGGLFTLHVLLNHPDSFRNFVASSPSIWWNDCAVLAGAPAFAARVEAGEAQPRVLITIGATEQDPPPDVPPGFTREQVDERVAQARMVDNAADLGARLAGLQGGPGYLAQYRCLDEDDHGTALGTAIARTLGFALK